MEPTVELIERIDAARLERARRMSSAEKLLAGAELYALAEECMKTGLRMQFPQESSEQILQRVKSRVRRMREREGKQINASH